LNGRARLGSLLVLALCLAPAISAQAPAPAPNRPAVFSMEKDRLPLASLDGQWRFHPGDDPRWASPDFDDSAWPLISSTQGWSEQGYKNMSGLAWYRARIVIPEGGQPLALYIPQISTSYQVFADGQLIGQFGGMPPHPRAYQFLARTFQLPQIVTGHAHQALIAIRVWEWPVWATYRSGGLQGWLLIGQPSLIDIWGAWRSDALEHELNSSIIIAVLDALAGITALALFAFRRREREYLWFGVAVCVNSCVM
jgi:phosphoserine phosphatase RsbU/P